MRHRWISLASLLACIVLTVVIVGCSGQGNCPTLLTGPSASSTGTVKLYMRAVPTTRQGVPLELQATINEIDLLNANTSDITPAPPDWQSILPTNPNIPIPILEGPTLIDLMTGGANPQMTEVVTAEVPAQLYSKIRLLLDPEFTQLLQSLPIDMSKYKNVIPITGGMQVDPGQTVSLLVDFFNGEATVIDN